MLAAVIAVLLAQAPHSVVPERASLISPASPLAVALDTGVLRHTSGRTPPVARALRVASPPHIDGHLDDEAWVSVEPITSFTQNEPHEGQPASESTTVRIVYDDEAIYVGARMYDSEPTRIVAKLGRRDGYTNSDGFTISFDSYHDHRTAFQFSVNPAGVKSDQINSSDNSYGDESWDPVWEVRTQRDSLGWTAEMRIPFSQLRYPRQAVQAWGINVSRYIQRRAESAEFAWKARTDQGYTSYFGHLFGLENLPQPRRLELLPYATSREERIPPGRSGDRFNDGSREVGAMGLDAKYGLTSNLTLDATLNPDFGQVEQDPAYVNLSAFEQFLSERRPFFVEGADIFRFGRGQLFYSRRIGRPPQGFPNSPGQDRDIPENSTIIGATKLSGRTRGGWSLGLLEAVTAREFATTYDRLTGLLHEDQVEPLTNYAVARVKRDLRGGSTTVGGIVTAVNRDISDPSLFFLRSSAYAGGVDFTHRFAHNRYSFSGSLAYSHVGGDTLAIQRAQRASARYFQRPDQDYVRYDPTRTSLAGWTGALSFGRIQGSWTYNFQVNATSPGYETNDAGFQTRADNRNVYASLTRRWTRPGRVFRQANAGLETGGSWNFGDVRTNTYAGTWGWGQLRNYWSVNWSLYGNARAFNDVLTRGGPLGIGPAGGSMFLGVGTDFRKPWEVFLGAYASRNEIGGRFANAWVSFSYRPTSAVRIRIEPSFSGGRTQQQYLQSQSDTLATATYGRQYVFGEIVQRSLDLTTRIDVTFSPALSLQFFVQPFVATGSYERFKELSAPRTTDFVVYGQSPGSTLTPSCFDDSGNAVSCTDPGAPPPQYYDADPDGAGPRNSVRIFNSDFDVRSLRGNAVLRWEYRPGSTIFFVWTTSCGAFGRIPRFRPGENLGRLCGGRSSNIFAVKANYWLNL